ncbi:hypothetical protein E4U60_000234 [Claviceps pazoutovae]|uniref:Uncharacterized protein n=1 Tax=Claviceps pazoutovae TaxID=1649127 RepID=A0A9P7MDZ1_9HYPO|nr:hypothetical protein E4U60_000234 [Claviceps pazoutovae]
MHNLFSPCLVDRQHLEGSRSHRRRDKARIVNDVDVADDSSYEGHPAEHKRSQSHNHHSGTATRGPLIVLVSVIRYPINAVVNVMSSTLLLRERRRIIPEKKLWKKRRERKIPAWLSFVPRSREGQREIAKLYDRQEISLRNRRSDNTHHNPPPWSSISVLTSALPSDDAVPPAPSRPSSLSPFFPQAPLPPVDIVPPSPHSRGQGETVKRTNRL